MPDPKVVKFIIQAAKKHGADPVALLATSLQESGGRFDAVGDNGSSFGPFQFHVGGALPAQFNSNPRAYTDTYDSFDNRARLFAASKVHGGEGAASIQRPADRVGYAAAVNAKLAQARQILASQGRLQSPTAPGGPGITPHVRPGTTSASQPGGVGVSRPPALAGPSPALIKAQQRQMNLQALVDSNAELAGIGSVTVPFKTPPDDDVSIPLSSPTAELPAAKAAGPAAANVVSIAKKYLGTKYVWGGESPKTGFDCSGLVQWAAGQVGVKLPRTTYEQYKVGTPVDRQNLQPGDSVFFHPTSQGPSHMGIYVGNGKFLHAPHTGDVVKISNLDDSYYQKNFMGGRRNQ